MVSRVDPLHWQVPITDKNGFPTPEFQRKWAQQHDVNSSVPDVSGGAAGALLYKLSADNLDVGWSTGLVWDETNGLHVAGATNVTGYLNVGSAGPPTNTTAGDLTALRAFIGVTPVVGPSGTLATIASSTAYAAGSATTIHLETDAVADGGGTSSPTLLELFQYITGANNANVQTGLSIRSQYDGTGTVTQLQGMNNTIRARNGGTVALGIALQGGAFATNSSTFAELRTIYASSPTVSTGGAITKASGLYVNTQAVAGVTKGYGVNQVGTSDLNVFAGRTTIGSAADPTASAALDVNSTTGAFIPPRMTTTQKNALTPTAGMIVQDTTLGKLQQYQGSAWGDIGSGSGSGGTFNGWFIDPAVSQVTSASGPAYNWAPVWLPDGWTIVGAAFRPKATSSTLVWATALYADTGGTTCAPAALLASSISHTGVTANTLAAADFTSPYTASGDQLVWVAYYISAAINIASKPGPGGFHTTGSALPFANPAPSNTTSTTCSISAYGTAP